jgi:hypothetical protein
MPAAEPKSQASKKNNQFPEAGLERREILRQGGCEPFHLTVLVPVLNNRFGTLFTL